MYKALILSAGEGTRVKRRFPHLPKGLIPIDGIPMIEHLLQQLSGFDITINVRKEEVKNFEYLKSKLQIEENPIGNAGAIKIFTKDATELFLVCYNDSYSDINPRKLIESHQGLMTMAVFDISRKKDFGIVVEENNRVIGFSRKRLCNMGFFSCDPKIEKYIGEGFQDIDEDLIPNLIRLNQLFIYQHTGFWKDIAR